MRTAAASCVPLLLCLLTTVSVFAAGEKPDASLGEKVAAYCQAHIGQQVGDGQCSALAGHALRDAGARTKRPADAPAKGDYVWGDLAVLVEADAGSFKASEGKLTDIHPGDVIQFRDTKFVHKQGRRTTTNTREHHTAVVKSVADNGRTIRIFEQNTGGKLIVKESTINVPEIKKGWMRFYRPVVKGSAAKDDE